MGDYRPLTDTLLLARSKTKYYGAFPAGFLGRGRDLLGVGPQGSVLHVCGGRVREYPFRGLGTNDKTIDLDPACEPDFLLDVKDGLPWRVTTDDTEVPWDAVLIDRPYTAEDADHYMPGRKALPNLNALLKMAFDVVPIGGRVGCLDYLWPHPGKRGIERFVGGVGTGRNSRARWYTVFERLT